MKKLTKHSKTSLFLMEMILSLLFLSLSCAACIQIFAAAQINRSKAREWNHIQELTTTAGEILEGSDGTAQSFLSLFPGGKETENGLEYSFDKDWNICDTAENATYKMALSLTAGLREKSGKLAFSAPSGELYQINLRFPLLLSKKEAAQ